MDDTLPWQAQAACRALTEQEADDLFFVKPGKSGNPGRNYCNTMCTVRMECLQYALIYGERGIWGGTTETERDQNMGFIAIQLKAEERRKGTLEAPLSAFLPKPPSETTPSLTPEKRDALEELLRQVEQSTVHDLLCPDATALLES